MQVCTIASVSLLLATNPNFAEMGRRIIRCGWPNKGSVSGQTLWMAYSRSEDLFLIERLIQEACNGLGFFFCKSNKDTSAQTDYKPKPDSCFAAYAETIEL